MEGETVLGIKAIAKDTFPFFFNFSSFRFFVRDNYFLFCFVFLNLSIVAVADEK